MWWQLIIAVVLNVISYALTPKTPTPTPPGIGTIDTPTAEKGIPLPVVFGTVLCQSPNVIWYGDTDTSPIMSGGGGGKK